MSVLEKDFSFANKTLDFEKSLVKNKILIKNKGLTQR